MKIPKLLTSLLISSASLTGASACAQGTVGSPRHQAPCSVSEDEIGVYAGFLPPDQGSSAVTVVEIETQPSNADVDYFNLQLALQGHAIPQDVRADFKQKDKSTCSIVPVPTIKNVHFISKAEHDKLFNDGWTKFHKRYGKHASWLYLSRVGFSTDKTLALLHVSSGGAPMAAGGRLYLLERKAGKWVIKTSIETWTT